MSKMPHYVSAQKSGRYSNFHFYGESDSNSRYVVELYAILRKNNFNAYVKNETAILIQIALRIKNFPATFLSKHPAD